MDRFISLGFQCVVPMILEDLGLRQNSYPFDWMLSTPKFVFEMLDLLLEKNISTDELVKNHFFNFKDTARYVEPMEYYSLYRSDLSENDLTDLTHNEFLFNRKHNVIFPHDTYNNETIEKYIRRFDRLKEYIIDFESQIYFVYISESSLELGSFRIDDKMIISERHHWIYKIEKLISKFRKNFKIIYIDFTNSSETIENPNITFIKTEPKDNWGFVRPVATELLREYNNNI